MKRRIFLFVIIFCFFILVFFCQKIIFVLAHGNVNGGVSIADTLQILRHGLSIDMSMSGYLSAIPSLLLVASVWLRDGLLEKMFNIYFGGVLSLISVVMFVDVVVYAHWGFHLDSTVILYMQHPKEVAASGSVAEWLIGSLGAVVFAVAFYLGYVFAIRKVLRTQTIPVRRAATSLILFLLTGLLFLPIRGGLTVSTMNIGHAYFSERMFLNHAAINPMFNFMYSLGKKDNFAAQYQFYNRTEAEQIFRQLSAATLEAGIPTQQQTDIPAQQQTDIPTQQQTDIPTQQQTDIPTQQQTDIPTQQTGIPTQQQTGIPTQQQTGIPSLLRISQPNILLFMLESFSYDVALDSVIAPNMSRFAKEGVFFEHFYANGFRTDRGIVSVLSGYPSHPTAAILKHPKKTESLPTISRDLRNAGYDHQMMYYGGDIKFANMQSYIVGACGIPDIVSDQDFPIKERMTKWGVPDGPLLDRVYRDLMDLVPDTASVQTPPFFKAILTLSSHEPFDVPTRQFEIPFLNSIHYTDECIGHFVTALKATNLWDNTLIVFVADHAMQGYPQGPDNYDPLRFHIPMIWIGGAVDRPFVVSDYGSQNDLAATLLAQLQIDHSAYTFSKNMLDPQSRKFAFYSYVNGFCMMDSVHTYLYDNNLEKVLKQSGDPEIEKQAKAYFQMMYLDLGNR